MRNATETEAQKKEDIRFGEIAESVSKNSLNCLIN